MSSRTPPASLPSELQVQRSGLQTVLSLLPYLWPRDNPGARLRVVVALVFMVLAKGATVYVPIVYSRAVDALAPKSGPAAMLTVPIALIGFYGLLRIGSAGFGELRDALFASVQQRAVRILALRTFQHLHAPVAALPHGPADRRDVAGDRPRHAGHAVGAAAGSVQCGADRDRAAAGHRHNLAHVRLALCGGDPGRGGHLRRASPRCSRRSACVTAAA